MHSLLYIGGISSPTEFPVQWYIYIYIIIIDIVFFCMNCTNLTNVCPKFPRASHRPSSGMPKRIPEFGPVRSKTSHSISGFTFVHHASELDISVFGGLVCDENMYSSFFFLVKNRAKPHILMKRFKIELIYSSWTKCRVSTRWWINYISIYDIIIILKN